MRARLFALLILVLIIGIPAGIYWYFFVNNTASVVLNILGADTAHVVLQGTLGNQNISIADELLVIEADCSSVCTLGPMAPVGYSLSITSPGKTQISDEISLVIGDKKMLTYTLQDELQIVPHDAILKGSDVIGAAVVAHAQKQDTVSEYALIGVDRDNIVYAQRRSLIATDIGVLSLDGFKILISLPTVVGRASIDTTGETIIVPLFAGTTLVYSLSTKNTREVPTVGVIGYTWGGGEKALTLSGVLDGDGASYNKNPRFTDWLDISDNHRLGYIDKDNTEKLQLSNLPPGESVLVSLDRTTGQYHILKRGVEVEFLFLHQGIPVFLDKQRNLWKIDTQKL